MAKKKDTVFICNNCNYESAKWLGHCSQCGEWNTFEEVKKTPVIKKGGSQAPLPGSAYRNTAKAASSTTLTNIDTEKGIRIDSGIKEVNQVLGGGIMRGSSILVGGEPGIGKSTLMLQIAAQAHDKGKILYISGEESLEQIKIRADRLKINNKNLELLCEAELDTALHVIRKVKPSIIIVDSIQTLYTLELGSVPGTVNQLKFCCHEIISQAKEMGAGVFLIAHVTKAGNIAGPKVIEHMVDTVLYFDQTESHIRVLRGTKNRFGSVDEIGLFTMGETGLAEVKDPASIFMVQREGSLPPGVSVAPVYEGSRVLMVEIQALTVPAKSGLSRTYSDRIDSGRVTRIAAVLEKHLGIRFSDQDVYVNVAGGIKLTEVGIELPIALALYSARTELPLPQGLTISGEITLAGEIRPIQQTKRRIKAAAEMGFNRFIAPIASNTSEIKNSAKNINLEFVKTLKEAILKTFKGDDGA